MSRTQKKCLIASSGLHVLLLVILIIGPAFLIKKEEPVDQTVLTLVSTEISDNAPQSQPAASAPAPQPEEVQPPDPTPIPPEPIPTPRPPVIKKPTEPVAPTPVVKEPAPVVPQDPAPTPPKKREVAPRPPKRESTPVQLDLTVKTDSTAQKRAEAERQRKERAEQARQLANALDKVGPNLDNKFTPGLNFSPTTIGTSGVSYTSYNAYVRSVYMNNWHPPTDMAATSSTVTVEVIISRDGTVKSARIIKRSGVSKLDADVTNLIKNRVKTIGHSFPDGATESERSYTIEFNLDLKLNG